MMDKGAVYGFTLSLLEYVETVPTLWEETKKFLASRPDLAPLMEGNAMKFLSDDNGETYNLVRLQAREAPQLQPDTLILPHASATSGVTLRLARSRSGGQSPTKPTLTSSTRLEVCARL
jgi:hypothetical protein